MSMHSSLFAPLDVETAPEESRPLLEKIQKSYKFITNMFATFANSPVLLEGYLGLEKVFDKGSLSAAERQLVLLTASIENDCNYCVAAHSTVLKSFLHVSAEVVSDVRSNLPLSDPKLNSLVALTRECVANRGHVEAQTIENFLAAGYRKEQILEVLMGVALKTMSNYADHISPNEVDVSEPQALSLTEIRRTVEDYGRAASNARAAGFDGVEIHAANGYLIDQFLRSKSNVRTDIYGGSAANRVRFLSEVVRAVLGVWERTRVGVRISPLGTFNNMGDANPEETFACVVDVLNGHQPGYLHVVEDTIPVNCKADFYSRLRSAWRGIYVANGGYDAERGERAVSDGSADAVAYGRLFLANPDLPVRLSRRGPLNVPDPGSFYGGDECGYIDYPEWTRSER